MVYWSIAVRSLRGDRAPPLFRSTQNTFLKHYVQDKATDNHGKWNNDVQT